ncbi:MAG: hypothetical protein E7583_09275 [Ruminococcaceae bacterium]|nr:hypothetical protein [Oscillospiraceae bacterium]
MYQLLIPIKAIDRTPEEFENLVGELKRAGTDEILLIYNRILRNEEKKQIQHDCFLKCKKAFEERGFKVGAWFAPTIGYGAPNGMEYGADDVYTRLTLHTGEEESGVYCPTDEKFVDEFCDIVKAIASTGVEKILFEDDYRLIGGKRTLPNVACYCKKHREIYAKLVGREVSGEELEKYLFEGGKNKYRDAWFKMLGDTLIDFTAEIERRVHAEYPDVKLGLSAAEDTYEMEGVDIATLTRIIAGKNRPFIRLTGAPYWDNAVTLAANIEAVRLQQYYCNLEGSDIELFTEGDTYPRPRSWHSAASLEMYDMILRADGGSHGILKYMIDYSSKALYETGYIDNHVLNAPHYAEIEKRFSGMECVGLNVFQTMNQFTDKKYDDLWTMKLYAPQVSMFTTMPTFAQWFLCDNSIPTTYGGKNCASIVFGDNAIYLDDETMKNGVILDAQAARILIERGIDIGVESYEQAQSPFAEHFLDEDEFTMARTPNGGVFFDFKLKPEAEVLSNFILSTGALSVVNHMTIHESPRFPACYFYENKDGQKFMVYSFIVNTVATRSHWRPGVFRSYCRQRQLMHGIEKLQGRPLPAMCAGNPELYTLVKKNDNEMAVGLWNIFADPILKPVIELDDTYDTLDTYNCTGKIEGNKVILDAPIPPYGLAFFTVKKNG